MKKMLRVGLFLLVGVLFVSCQQKVVFGPSQFAGVVRVNGDGSFTDYFGTVIRPDVPSLLSASMALIYCEYTPVEVPVKQVDVKMLAEPEGVDGVARVVDKVGGATDMKSNVAIIGWAAENVARPLFFDSKTLVLPIPIYIKNETESAAKKSEIASHTFNLICYSDPIAAGDKELKLYLRHMVQGDASVERPQPALIYQAYSLAGILRDFKAKSGVDKPSVVRVYFDENRSSGKLGVGLSSENSVELPYAF